MEQHFYPTEEKNKKTRYEEFLTQYAGLIEGESNAVSVMANTSAALKEAFGFFWVGFYLVEGDTLVLGPFQGDVACYRIRKGRGVCGTAWAEGRTLVVPDVDAFPGHIACSSLSRSETSLSRRSTSGSSSADQAPSFRQGSPISLKIFRTTSSKMMKGPVARQLNMINAISSP